MYSQYLNVTDGRPDGRSARQVRFRITASGWIGTIGAI